MITTNNIKDLISLYGFEKDLVGNYYKHTFSDCTMAVDLDNQKLIYPEEKGLIVNDKTTSNFSHPENFVVFECVCRLLAKGYRPEHIELEPRWTLGHDAKGGKADILVKDENGESLLIIECKTSGPEFNKEKKNTEEDGGQLFSYWQQEGATRWLALYTVDFKDEEIDYKCICINCTDDANIVKINENDSDLHIYKNARNDKERFNVWLETYGLHWDNDVVFCDDSQAYNIGIPPLRKGQLRDFTPEDQIVNRFEEILRHNNVSDKENAFNRLVALFICKLVDEIMKTDLDEVDFQYKQGADTYESLQDRLQRLHKLGMEEFMKEKIFYVEADYAEKLFLQYTGKKRKEAINDLNRTIRILKFYSNNDFAFKDVHNEELFFQNGKILVEVVQLFQSYRIVYTSKHQFLGDLFEQLLDKGFKQNEGQFFTPMPITRFIWDSLPIKDFISNNDLPRIIDYACGAGHFLTEAIEAINSVRTDANNDWVEKHVFGIEKDYRLARVSKISMFMNGAGHANIIFGDGLENYAQKGITNGSFDILVANPPYSVSGFKQHLKLKENKFDLMDKVTQNSKEIEALFVERAAQLLRPKGVAAIILPVSILSNSGIYTAAREQLLKNFIIHAIVSLGGKTFGATDTNTVILFLERYNEPPIVSRMTDDIVDGIMSDPDNSEWQDKEILNKYIQHQNLDCSTYRRFILRELSQDELQQDDYLSAYIESFNSTKISYPSKSTEEEKKDIYLNRLYNYALSIEREKIYYFSLVCNQKTIVITSPEDVSGQKVFLGYGWDKNTGIKTYKRGGLLYDDSNRFASNTLASLIRYSYYGGDISITLPEEVEKYSKTYSLKDLLGFNKVEFDKSIKTKLETAKEIQSDYPIYRLKDIVEVRIGGTPARKELSYFNGEHLWVSIAEMNGQVITETKETITDLGVSNSNVKLIPQGTALVSFKLSIGKTAIAGKDLYTNEAIAGLVPLDSKSLRNEYLFYYFKGIGFNLGEVGNKAFGKSLNSTYLREEVKIPLPPVKIQEALIAKCNKVDEEYNSVRMSKETYRNKITDIFNELNIVKRNKDNPE